MAQIVKSLRAEDTIDNAKRSTIESTTSQKRFTNANRRIHVSCTLTASALSDGKTMNSENILLNDWHPVATAASLEENALISVVLLTSLW